MCEKAYQAVIVEEFKDDVLALIKGAPPSMLATHDRNKNKDCSGNAEVADAFVTSDSVESIFGIVDEVLSSFVSK